ncbi:MAG: type II toxin-antitoxin system YafQ family toxin [Flavobacteriia bacterium]|nr:type II toxin-antitoxin system YafQ family toxin [Flavobacteriia bacterium]
MYEIISGGRFKKDLKRFKNNPEKIQKISVCVELLSQGGVENIPPEMKPHKLLGIYKDSWECHIQSDLLIIWFQIDEPAKEIHLIRVGSHSELF